MDSAVQSLKKRLENSQAARCTLESCLSNTQSDHSQPPAKHTQLLREANYEITTIIDLLRETLVFGEKPPGIERRIPNQKELSEIIADVAQALGRRVELCDKLLRYRQLLRQLGSEEIIAVEAPSTRICKLKNDGMCFFELGLGSRMLRNRQASPHRDRPIEEWRKVVWLTRSEWMTLRDIFSFVSAERQWENLQGLFDPETVDIVMDPLRELANEIEIRNKNLRSHVNRYGATVAAEIRKIGPENLHHVLMQPVSLNRRNQMKANLNATTVQSPSVSVSTRSRATPSSRTSVPESDEESPSSDESSEFPVEKAVLFHEIRKVETGTLDNDTQRLIIRDHEGQEIRKVFRRTSSECSRQEIERRLFVNRQLESLRDRSWEHLRHQEGSGKVWRANPEWKGSKKISSSAQEQQESLRDNSSENIRHQEESGKVWRTYSEWKRLKKMSSPAQGQQESLRSCSPRSFGHQRKYRRRQPVSESVRLQEQKPQRNLRSGPSKDLHRQQNNPDAGEWCTIL